MDKDKEQIIIDSVDVSKCESYNPLGNYSCGGCRRCEEKPNCYFKQLARKTQECKDLKLCLQQSKDNNKSTLKLLENKHKECEESKELTEVSFAKYQSLKIQYKNLIEINNKRKDEIKTLKYMLYEEKELSPELFKANFKIAKLERDISSHKNRFKNELAHYRKVISNIEEFCITYSDNHDCYEAVYKQILAFINKAKGVNHE